MAEFDTARLFYYLAAFGLSYLLGSVMFGLVLTKLAGIGDPRAIGSGNLGATNVLRTGRKDIAAATLIFDALKGTFAVFVARAYGMDVAMIAGLGAFLGHLFPLWLKFRGGKGVATYVGIVMGFSLSGLLIFAACWLCTAYATRFSSASAIAAGIATPLAFLFMGDGTLALFFALLSALLIWKHSENIARLQNGTESKIKLS